MNTKKTGNDMEDVNRVRSSGWKKPVKYISLAVICAVIIYSGVFLWQAKENNKAPRYITAEVRKDDLVVTVTATGTLEPVNKVDVGTEISGTIETVEVDYNHRVKAGQTLAKLDTDKLEAQVLQSSASLESARAKLLNAQATVSEALSDLERLNKVRELTQGKIPSKADLNKAENALARAKADEAAAGAQILQAEADLSITRTNLRKAVIHSPINGIVLKRQVEPGQTVAASLQTPVLFTIAENLQQMELKVAVDEADVGHVREGQKASFIVDAYPERKFPAVITEVRFSPQTVEGVVTYETLMSVDNTDLFLRPGMTATADIIVRKLENVILIPNAALRFEPPVISEGGKKGGGLVGMLLPRFPPRTPKKKESSSEKGRQRVWILKEGKPEAVSIKVGSSDGQMTEVLDGDLQPGVSLLVDVVNQRK